MIDLRREGAVFVLTMNAGENRLNRPFLDAFGTALDEVEGASGPVALVTTGGTEKFYSNGLDLDWLGGDGQAEAATFVESVVTWLARVAALDVPTVAAINGHAFAAGGMLALAHDFRVMRADRGYFCLNEVDIGLPLHRGMTALIKSRLSPLAARDVVLTGARFGGDTACARGIVDEAVPGADVLPRALARAAELAQKNRAIYGALKRGLATDLLAGM